MIPLGQTGLCVFTKNMDSCLGVFFQRVNPPEGLFQLKIF